MFSRKDKRMLTVVDVLRLREKSINSCEGFSLIEMLVVLAIMGFLAALAAPRFGGITQKGVTTTSRMSMARLVDYITDDLQRDGHYPSGMINIVSVDSGTGTYYKPMVSDQDPDNEPEVLGYDMDHRHRFFLHYLSAAEAAELRSMGIVHVYNYNSPYDRNVTVGSPYMEQVDAGVAVLMTGGGDADDDGTIAAAEMDSAEADRGHPDQMFRILFGLGPETSLIKDGIIANAGTCPESRMDPINYVWKWYGLLLPRLDATVARLQNDDPLGVGGSGEVTAYGISGTRTTPELQTVLRRNVELYQNQHRAFFAILDAEGATLPGDEPAGWGIDFDASTDIN